ncbi:hypothetical protein [Paenibacillus macerans]|uniref:hypothetical protein n=1 Tax=Paenibacillus macerans TaxID=44252 RepID=UPI003D31FC6B
MKYFRKKLSGDRLRERIFFSVILWAALFFGVMILSCFLLPEGVLKNRNPLQNWETSDNTFILVLQIFFYNQLSVLVIIAASLFAKKKARETYYLSLGYLTFFTLMVINGVVVGTWSFSVESEPVPLFRRVTRTFDLVHRAGLWEMMGQLLITCSVARIAIILTSGKDTVTRKFSAIRLGKPEKMAFASGFVLMLIGAIVESFAIHSL